MTTYYVKPTGDNTKDGLSEANAWETITYALTQMIANDELIIAAAAYAETVTITTEHITLTGAGSGLVTIDSLSLRASYPDCSGMTATSATSIATDADITNVTLDDIIGTQLVALAYLNNAIITNCDFTHCLLPYKADAASISNTIIRSSATECLYMGASTGANLTFENMTIMGVPPSGGSIEIVGSMNPTFTNTTFEYPEDAIKVHAGVTATFIQSNRKVLVGTVGTNTVTPTESTLVVADGTYDYRDFIVTPDASVVITTSSWQTSGSRNKEWSVIATGSRTIAFHLGDMLPSTKYNLLVDGAETSCATSNGAGVITFPAYTGSFSTKVFSTELNLDHMKVPYLTVYTKDPDGVLRGEYTTFHPRNAEIKFIQHSLNEGDRMVFTMWLDDREQELDSKRPIRFYTDDDTKLFDGQIIDTKYIGIGNNYQVLEVTANGWWQELASMDFHQPVEYDETETPNSIFADLVRLANNMGTMKEAIYAYDTDRIPGYNEHTAAYTTATGTSFSFSNVYQAMQEMTRFMDVAENSSTYEFGLRIETLPRVVDDCNEAITVSDVSGSSPSIYILPFILDMDKAVAATYNKFQLDSDTVRRDYRRLANDVVAIGDDVVTQQIRTDQILTQKDVSSNDQSWARDEQVLASHYLRVTIENPTLSDFRGWVQITRVSGATNPVETFPMYVPAGGIQIQYTSERTEDGLPVGNCVRAVDFNGGKITVDEVTNDGTPCNTTIAGASINDYGLHSHRIDELWLNTQTRVDYAAGKHCRLYHNPMHVFDGEVLQRYIEYTNLIGRTVDAYSPFVEANEGFLITDVLYSFKDTKIEQRLKGYRHEYSWDYDDTNIYVMDNSLLNHVITSTFAKVVI